MSEDPGFQRRIERIDSLVKDLESIADPSVQSTARELMESVMDLHGAALGQILTTISGAGEAGPWILERLEENGLVGGLLVLYGLQRADFETRVKRGLERIQPFLHSHGAAVHGIRIRESEVELTIRINGHARDLSSAVRDAIHEAAPDAADIRIAEESVSAGFVPLTALTGNGHHPTP